MKHHRSLKGISLDDVDWKLFSYRTRSAVLGHSSAFTPVLINFHKTKALRKVIARQLQNLLTIASDTLKHTFLKIIGASSVHTLLKYTVLYTNRGKSMFDKLLH